MSADVARAVGQEVSVLVDAAVVKDLGTRFESRVTDHFRRVLDVLPDVTSPDDTARLMAQAVLHGPDGTLRGGTNEVLRGIVARDLVSR